MQILIIGSNSFAGSSFCKFLLVKKFKVIGVSRSKQLNDIFLPYKKSKFIKNFKFFKIDLNQDKDQARLMNIIKKYKIKYIVNFAAQGMVAQSWINPQDWYNTNITSNAKLIKKLSRIKIKKYLNFSTPEVYGNLTKKIKENKNFLPSTPYAVSRTAQDLNLLAYNKFFNFPVVFTRAANIFGPGQQLYRIVPKAIICAISDKILHLHGGGKSVRSFIYMDDVCVALEKILFDPKNVGQTFHISTNRFISIEFLVKNIFKLLNANINNIKVVSDRKGKDHGYLLNSNKLRKKYNWRPSNNLKTGLETTIRWVLENFSFIKKQNLEYEHKK